LKIDIGEGKTHGTLSTSILVVVKEDGKRVERILEGCYEIIVLIT